jgi:RHS repeat-associated protein
VELDETGRIISYEEYYPYGGASYQAMDAGIKAATKRYRYTGKERDEETGLNYHGARYYAPWLGRWTAADPAEMADGVNRFAYSRNSPIVRVDHTGKRSGPSDESSEIAQLKSDLENKFQVQFDPAKVRDAYAAEILSFGRVEGRDRIEQLNEEIAKIEGREFNMTELRVLEQALTLVEPFRTKNLEGDDMPIAIARLEKGLIMANPPIVGLDILVKPRKGPIAGLAFSDGATRATALFDLSEDATIDKSFAGRKREDQLLGLYVHELLHLSLEEAPGLEDKYFAKFGRLDPVSSYAEESLTEHGIGDRTEAFIEASKQFLINPEKFRRRHPEQADFFKEELHAIYGRDMGVDEWMSDLSARARTARQAL